MVKVDGVALVSTTVRRVVDGAHASVPFPESVRFVSGSSELGCNARHVPRDGSEARYGVGAVGSAWVEVEGVHVIRVAPRLNRRPRGAAIPETLVASGGEWWWW